MNVAITNSNSTSPPNAEITHLVHVTSYDGDSNLTDTCAVNRVGSSSGNQGQTFIANGSAGSVYTLTAPRNIASFTIASFTPTANGGAATGSLRNNPTGSITQTAAGFNFTLPDGKTVNYTLTAGAQDIDSTSDYETLTTDGSRDVETTLTNGATSTLSSSTYGKWIENDTNSNPLEAGVFAVGISGQTPTTGSATYTGNIDGVIVAPSDAGTIKSGTVSLTANFATGTFTGTVTNVATKFASDNSASGTGNSLTFSGTIGSGGNGISGTVTPSGAAGTQFDLSATTGTFAGKFWGSNGAEVAGTLTLTGGGITVFAAFGAHQ
jgi:hypothetical protein